MPVTSAQRFWHNAAREGERLEQQAHQRNATNRRLANQDNRNFNRAISRLEDSYNHAISYARDTRDKRRLRAERDARIDQAISDRERADNPTDPNTTIDDNSTDQTGSNPENGDGGSSDGGGGLPDGYVETAVTICVNGSPVIGQFLFKEDTP